MKTVTLILLSIGWFYSYAQDYILDFNASGEAESIDSISVENITQGTKITIEGNTQLHLVETVGLNNGVYSRGSSPIEIYPNPALYQTTLRFYNEESGWINFQLYGASGILTYQNSFQVWPGECLLKLSDIPPGLNFIRISGNKQMFAGTIVGTLQGRRKPNVVVQIQSEYKTSSYPFKGTSETIQMQYNRGDRLKMQAFSGIWSSVISDILSESSTINFNFVTCQDHGGCSYPTLTIGAQTWMASNLTSTTYNDGTPIPNVTEFEEWKDLSTPAYCWQDNNPVVGDVYGALYNGYVIDSSNLCPSGWHVPTDEEWETLNQYLGGTYVAGGKLKESGYTHWIEPNKDATNSTGFTALPGGCRMRYDDFAVLGRYGYWWSSTSGPGWNYYRSMSQNTGNLSKYHVTKKYGMSVRCIKD